jgi:thioredoxin 1
MSVKELSSKGEFEALITSTPFVAIEAGAAWCGPCKAIGPIFNKHAHDYTIPDKYVFAKFDTDDVPELAAELGVQSIPAFWFFENGEVTNRVSGAYPPALQDAVGELLYKAKA